jgi:hypothetical protein
MACNRDIFTFTFTFYMGFRSKRAFRLKQHKKISKIGLSWMKENLDFSFSQRKKLLQ